MLQIFELEVHLGAVPGAVKRRVLQISFPDIGPYDFFSRNYFGGDVHRFLLP
jgi:hypothetical protein